jgi:acyl-[acyl-carrier-protein]-phospholipid O-acyltransferase/long-chain-fatty-acid--[acyl-carrier-protein] ligase
MHGGSSLPVTDQPWRRGFWSLIITQFQGAFSDNAYKFLLIFLIAGSGMAKDRRDLLVLVVGVLFSIPFILFSMTGGYLADRFSKRSVTIGTKVLEIAVMLLALAGLSAGSTALQLAAVFLMSAQSALFGPAKYGLLPELVPKERLSWANGMIELYTFLAIITGTVAGGAMASRFRQSSERAGLILVALAVAGLMASLGVTRIPPADLARRFRLNFLGDLCTQIGRMRRDRVLWLAVLGNTYLWFLAALLQFNIVFYGTDILRLNEDQNGYLQAAIAIGIGVGSAVAG